MLKVLIDSGSGYVDYTSYVIQGSLQVAQTINQPTHIDFRLCNFDSAFVIPSRSSYVKVLSTKYSNLVLATGFITQEPEKVYYGDSHAKNLLEYHVLATSDEWLLNLKSVPMIPAYVNQTMGHILRSLAETLVPVFFAYDIDDGDILPYYKYDPKKTWSEIAKEFYDSIRFHYYVLNKKIYFKPIGDLNLGIHYDDSPTRLKSHFFDPQALETQLQPAPVVNDAVIIGDVEPRSYVEDNFIGDGFTSDFPLKKKVFRGASQLLLQEDWSGTRLDSNLWTSQDFTGKFQLSGALNLVAGSGSSTLGTAYILGNNGLELGGHLNVQSGDIEFTTGIGSGILGGIYSTAALTLATCNVGFFVSGSTISPIVNGVLQSAMSTVGVSTSQLSKRYILQAVIDSSKWSRYNRIFRTLAGQSYGGTSISSTSDVTFIIQEVLLPAPTIPVPAPKAVVTVRRSEIKSVTLPAFGLFAPVNSINLQASMVGTLISQPPQGRLTVQSLYGPSGSNLPVHPENLSTKQKYALGFGMSGQVATIQATNDVQLLSFYADTIPAVGARIKLRTWEAGAAIGRVRSDASILAEGKVSGDNGIRTAVVSDFSPLPRTSEECELAGAAFIADRIQTQYNGSYEVDTQFWTLNAAGVTGNTDYPRPGRFFNIKSSMRNITNRDFLVQSVLTKVEVHAIEQMKFGLQFGPDLYVNKLLPKFLKQRNQILTAEDTATPPTPQDIANIGLTYLGDLPSATITAFTGTDVSIDLGQVPVTGAEVRRIDSGWGDNDGNRLALKTTQTFSLARTAIDQSYYIRQVNGSKTSRYTTVLRTLAPLIPASPTGVLDVRDRLKPVIQADLTGDVRDICGIEVRSCMVNVAAVSGVPKLATNLEVPMELLLGQGLIGDDKSVSASVPIGSQDYTTKKKFTRSEFLFDSTLHETGTTFVFEAVVTNSAFRDTPARNIYIEKQMRGRTNGNPTIVHTLAVPAGSIQRRIRFSTPFSGYLFDSLPPSVEGPTVTGAVDYTDAYRVWMQAEVPPVLAYNAATTFFPSSSFELHSLRLIAITQAAQKTAIDIPMLSAPSASGSSTTGSNTDVGISAFSTTSTSNVDVDAAGIWKYVASEWSSISSGRFIATLSSPAVTGSVTASLYDIEATTVIATAVLQVSSYQSQAAAMQGTFTRSNLIDGHTYTVQLKVSSQVGASGGHIYAAWIRLIIKPIQNLNIYWRFAAAKGLTPVKVTDAGIRDISAGSFLGRLLYNSDALSTLTGALVEGTGKAGLASSLTDDFNRSNGPINVGQPDWDKNGHGQFPNIVSNQIQLGNVSTNVDVYAQRTSTPVGTSFFAKATYVSQSGGSFSAAGPIVCANNIAASQDFYMAWSGRDGAAGSDSNDTCAIMRRSHLTAEVKLWTSAPGVRSAGKTQEIRAVITATEVTLSYLQDGIVIGTAVDSSSFRLPAGRVGLSAASGDGIRQMIFDNFDGGIFEGVPETCALVNANGNDGPNAGALPGWFGYTSGDHVPAQAYTVNPNMQGYSDTLTIISAPSRIIDDFMQAIAGVIMSAWQFELLAAVLGAIAGFALVAINAYRDTLVSAWIADVIALDVQENNWVTGSELTFSSATKEMKRATLSLDDLTSGNRYYGSVANTTLVHVLLVLQVSASFTLDEEDEVTTTPVPEAPSVLIQRRYLSSADLNLIFDNNPYRIRLLCFKVFFFNLMWEYSPELELTANLLAPPVPNIEVISVMSIDIQIRLNLVSTEDTKSVTMEMSPNSLFVGAVVRVKGGPLQSVYSLHIPGGPNVIVVGQYIRARRSDYLGNSAWSPVIFVSAADIANSSYLSSSISGGIVSDPFTNLFSYVSDGTTITWSWNTFTLTYSDGFIQYVLAGSFTTFTGLSNSTTYKFYPYLEGIRTAISTVIILLSAVSGGTGDDPAAVSVTNLINHTPLSRADMDAATTGGGGGSGSGGGVG